MMYFVAFLTSKTKKHSQKKNCSELRKNERQKPNCTFPVILVCSFFNL